MALCCSISKMFGLAKDMKVTKLITNMVAFNPPSDIQYKITKNKDMNNIIPTDTKNEFLKVNFEHAINDNISSVYPWLEQECYLLNKSTSPNSKKAKNIVLLHIINKTAKNNDNMTIIFSHGNSCDLGNTYAFLLDLATQLKVKYFI
jgi:hypothetical protein